MFNLFVSHSESNKKFHSYVASRVIFLSLFAKYQPKMYFASLFFEKMANFELW
jgi:hypothetical protein